MRRFVPARPRCPTACRRARRRCWALARGASNHDIAQALFLSPRTVQRHVANVYLKIDAHNRAEATAYALKHHLA
ncbi:MAG: LuxR C-terminal-related transcriptional regulator [Thermomicrobiales bacterium]